MKLPGVKREYTTTRGLMHEESGSYKPRLWHFLGAFEERNEISNEKRISILEQSKLRNDITRDIEGPYKKRIENMGNEIKRLEAEVENEHRAKENFKSELNAVKREYEREIDKLKATNKSYLNDLNEEVKLLREKLQYEADYNKIIKEELEDCKQKIMSYQEQNEQVKNHNNQLQTLLSNSENQKEYIKNQNKSLLKELENQKELITTLREEFEAKDSKLEEMLRTNDSLKVIIDEYEKRNEVREEINRPLLESNIKKSQFTLSEQDDKETLQEETKQLTYKEPVNVTKEDFNDLIRMYEVIERERNVLREECKMLRARVSELQASFEHLKENHMKLLNEREDLEAHINNAKAKQKVLRNHVNELSNEKLCLEGVVNSLKNDYNKVKGEAKTLALQKRQLEKKVLELTEKVKCQESEGDKQKKKALAYKHKALEANLEVKRIAEKLSRTQIEFSGRKDLTPLESPIRNNNLLKSMRLTDPYSISDVKQLETEIKATLHKHT